MASKEAVEQEIVEAAKIGTPVFASKFAREHGYDEHTVKLAMRRLDKRGRIFQAMRPSKNFFGSTEAGYKANCDKVDGCYRVHGHNGNCAMKVS